MPVHILNMHFSPITYLSRIFKELNFTKRLLKSQDESVRNESLNTEFIIYEMLH